MLERLIQPADRVRIYYLSAESKKYYLSQVEEVNGDRILISAPIKLGKVIHLSENRSLRMDFYTDKGIYRTVPQILKESQEGNLYFITLKVNKDHMDKIQRRNYFRVDCLQSARILDFNFQDTAHTKELTLPEKCNIINISGGGLKFISKDSFKIDGIITMELDLSTKEADSIIPCKGKIISCEAIYDKSNRYVHRIEITDILPKNREKIIRFVFDQQVRQKGK